jgi:hypothetical protein
VRRKGQPTDRPASWVLASLLGLGACGERVPPAAPSPAAPPAAPSPAEVGPEPWFVDVTASSGVDFVHDAGMSAERHLPETMGGGGALADLDRDGDLDLYLVQSGQVPQAGDGARGPEIPCNQLYLNRGDGRFVDHTAHSGAAADRGCGQGVAAGDVDGDGLPDLYVTNFGPDLLLHNAGGARFEDATAAAGLGDPRWTAGASFFDADADGDLDLFVTGYVQIDVEQPEWCGRQEEGWRSYCHPDRFPAIADRFYRNLGDGRFEAAEEQVGLTGLLGKGLGVLPVDAELDGDVDLYVANDGTENHFWRNLGGRFRDDTLIAGVGVDGDGRTEAGMGLCSGDLDGDLDLDLYVTNFDNESNTYYRNDGEWYTDATVLAGLEAPSRLPVGFGTVAEDFDLDGDLDLAVANGHIIHNIDRYHDGKTWRQRAQLYQNRGRGRFAEVRELAGPLGAEPRVGRGLLCGDLDGDGDGDLVLIECGGPVQVLRNDQTRGSLTVRGLPQHAVLRAVLDDGQELLAVHGPQPSYYGACAPEARFGLGDERRLAELWLVSPRRERLDLERAREIAPRRWLWEGR